MLEEKTAPVYYTKDFDGYSMSTDNFVANQELMWLQLYMRLAI